MFVSRCGTESRRWRYVPVCLLAILACSILAYVTLQSHTHVDTSRHLNSIGDISKLTAHTEDKVSVHTDDSIHTVERVISPNEQVTDTSNSVLLSSHTKTEIDTVNAKSHGIILPNRRVGDIPVFTRSRFHTLSQVHSSKVKTSASAHEEDTQNEFIDKEQNGDEDVNIENSGQRDDDEVLNEKDKDDTDFELKENSMLIDDTEEDMNSKKFDYKSNSDHDGEVNNGFHDAQKDINAEMDSENNNTIVPNGDSMLESTKKNLDLREDDGPLLDGLESKQADLKGISDYSVSISKKDQGKSRSSSSLEDLHSSRDLDSSSFRENEENQPEMYPAKDTEAQTTYSKKSKFPQPKVFAAAELDSKDTDSIPSDSLPPSSPPTKASTPSPTTPPPTKAPSATEASTPPPTTPPPTTPPPTTPSPTTPSPTTPSPTTPSPTTSKAPTSSPTPSDGNGNGGDDSETASPTRAPTPKPTIIDYDHSEDQGGISLTSFVLFIGFIGIGILVYRYCKSGRRIKFPWSKGPTGNGPSFERIPMEDLGSARRSPEPQHFELSKSHNNPYGDAEQLLKNVMSELGIPEFGSQKYLKILRDCKITKVDQLRELDDSEWKRLSIPEVIKNALKKSLSESKEDDLLHHKGWNLADSAIRRHSRGNSSAKVGVPSGSLSKRNSVGLAAQELDGDDDLDDLGGWGDAADLPPLTSVKVESTKVDDPPQSLKAQKSSFDPQSLSSGPAVNFNPASSSAKSGSKPMSLKPKGGLNLSKKNKKSSSKPEVQEIIASSASGGAGWDLDLEFDSL